MKKKMWNETHIEGYLYEHDLQIRETGPNSKNPGTTFISGTISIATNDAQDNIVPVHYTYVTQKTSKGTDNATFGVLKSIVEGDLRSIMEHGADNATKLRVDSAIGLNEFYSDRTGTEELVSVKRNEGGFVHTTPSLNDSEKERNTFKADILITGVKHVDADEERELPEKAIVKGYVFDFRKSILPVEFSVLHSGAIQYFEGLDASQKNPVFTQVKGVQVSETIVRKIEEPSAFGEASIREVKSTKKDWVITWAAKEEYEWNSEETLTEEEMIKAKADRDIYLASIKKRQDEYKAQKTAAATTAPAPGGFKF